ncbi:MAG: hypothetical protein WCQ87_00110 [Parabacteroides sp.]
MKLYSYLTLESFVEGAKNSSLKLLPMQLSSLMYAFSDSSVGYGLSLLRHSILRYEKEQHVSKEKSKSAMPFFRNHRKLFVGPEIEMYVRSFYETPLTPHDLKDERSLLKIAFDYEVLVDYCLTDNCNLIRCKYDAEECIENFVSKLKVEYDKFFYTEEHTGFKSDSQFFSMLCNASLEMVESQFKEEKEWRLMQFCAPEDASYHMSDDQLLPYIQISVPYDCIRSIELLDWQSNESTYSALAGLMQHMGLPPERFLEGLIEDE